MKYGYHPKLPTTTQVPFIVNTVEIPFDSTVKLLFDGTKYFHMHGILYVDGNTENASLYMISVSRVFQVYRSTFKLDPSYKADIPVINTKDYSISFNAVAWSNIVFISFTDRFKKIDIIPLS